MRDSRKVRSRYKLLGEELKSELQFRELKTKKSKFGFTSRVVLPEEIMGVGKGLEIAKHIDPAMDETVIQYNRNTYEKNRMFIYTNNDNLANALRQLKKVATVSWKSELSQIT